MILPLKKLLFVFVASIEYSYAKQQKTQYEFDGIGGYQPLTDVRDHATIDLDNAIITALLRYNHTDEAKKVYEQGAFSRSYAHLQFGAGGLPADIEAHSPVVGTNNKGDPIKGMLLEAASRGEKFVRVLYDQFENEHNCYVGGHPEPVYDGCFAKAGELHFYHFDQAIRYSYNQHHDNKNDRILKWFSTLAARKMKPCPNCEYYKEFDRFLQFYGRPDYADRWIMTALDGARHVFDSSAADFEGYDLESRTSAARIAMVTMSMSMFVIREMEDAIRECKKSCTDETCRDKSVHIADAAAAMYIGSLEGIDGTGEGKLMYNVADTECREFKTCGKNNDKTHGKAKANIEIIRAFQEMQANLTNHACAEARIHKDKIAQWMTVPLIQGTLRFAYLRSAAETGEISNFEKAIGAVYAASVVPIVAACSFKDAEIIGKNMETTAESTDFALVKEAFERHYSCLGIRCQDIGGYWDRNSHMYFYMADPCTFDVTEAEIQAKKDKRKHVIAWAIGVPLFLLASLLVYSRVRRMQAKKRKRALRRARSDFSDSSFSDDSSLSDSSTDGNFVL